MIEEQFIEHCNPSIMNKLNDLKEDLNNDFFTIIVLGEFKRGKSTFVNALLGTKLLPVDVIPTTATISSRARPTRLVRALWTVRFPMRDGNWVPRGGRFSTVGRSSRPGGTAKDGGIAGGELESRRPSVPPPCGDGGSVSGNSGCMMAQSTARGDWAIDEVPRSW